MLAVLFCVLSAMPGLRCCGLSVRGEILSHVALSEQPKSTMLEAAHRYIRAEAQPAAFRKG
jgi:hypothetical protein